MRGELFDIDVSDVTEFAVNWKGPRAIRIVQGELVTAGQRSGRIVRDKANARVRNRTGRLTKMVAVTTRASQKSVSTDVIWSAKSDKGFAYPRVVNDGRGPVFAKPGKVLRFVIDGNVLFRKSVGPAKGVFFAERGLETARPNIIAEHTKARDTIVSKLETM